MSRDPVAYRGREQLATNTKEVCEWPALGRSHTSFVLYPKRGFKSEILLEASNSLELELDDARDDGPFRPYEPPDDSPDENSSQWSGDGVDAGGVVGESEAGAFFAAHNGRHLTCARLSMICGEGLR